MTTLSTMPDDTQHAHELPLAPRFPFRRGDPLQPPPQYAQARATRPDLSP